MTHFRKSIPTQLAERMKRDWDDRVSDDYRFWMSDGTESDTEMWTSGARDFSVISAHLPSDFAESAIALEIGCGVGRLLRAASANFQQVIGVDVSPTAISRAQTLLKDCENVDLLVTNGDGLPQLPDESIDFAYSFASLSNMPVAVIAAYLSEMSRVVREGGYVSIQLYLGSKQPTLEEDTLAIRVLDRNGVFQVLHDLGFQVLEFEELKLPFEVSDHSNDATAYMLFLERQSNAPRYLSNIELLLVPGGEESHGSSFTGSETAYAMAVSRASQHLEKGRTQEAIHILRYAVRCIAEPEKEVLEILQKLEAQAVRSSAPRRASYAVSSAPTSFSAEVGSAPGTFWSENLAVIERRFPELLQSLQEDSGAVSVRRTSSGESVLMLENTPLDNVEKPARGGEVWAERALTALHPLTLQSGDAVTVVGFAGGYHIEALLKRDLDVAVLEPRADVLRAAMQARDLRFVLERVKAIAVSDEHTVRTLGKIANAGELLIYPQTQLVSRASVDRMKQAFWSARGVAELRPSIAVVGPLYGGTLPISRYVADTMTSLKQRSAFYDVSSFNPSFSELNRYIKDSRRVDVLQEQYVELLSEMVLQSTAERPIDILICLAQAPLSPRALTELRRRGTITVMWFVEDYRRFTSWKQLSQYFDYMFLIQRGEALEQVQNAGAGRALYLPVAAHGQFHRPLTLTPEERKEWGSTFSFVGAGYHNRQQMFAALADRDFKIWGTEWPTCAPFDKLVQANGKRIDPADYLKIFAATDVNINLHSSSERDGVEPHGDFVNPRTFELAAAGAFQLVDRRELLPEMFDIGTELATFSDKHEMLSKLDYYAAHPEERETFAANARARVLRDHTYEIRIKQLLGAIYADRYQELRAKTTSGAWPRVLEASKEFPELRTRLERIHERGEEPKMDHIVADIKQGSGTLTDTEQKLMFLHHIRSQITYIEGKRSGKS